jgi:hypothetical protein
MWLSETIRTKRHDEISHIPSLTGTIDGVTGYSHAGVPASEKPCSLFRDIGPEDGGSGCPLFAGLKEEFQTKQKRQKKYSREKLAWHTYREAENLVSRAADQKAFIIRAMITY